MLKIATIAIGLSIPPAALPAAAYAQFIPAPAVPSIPSTISPFVPMPSGSIPYAPPLSAQPLPSYQPAPSYIAPVPPPMPYYPAITPSFNYNGR